MHDLSMTIVAYNNYADILNAINSLITVIPDTLSFHVYIVDNSSTDESMSADRAALMLLLSKYNNFEYINSGGNLGFGKGHNYVLPKLNSRFHAIVNPDIIFVEDPFSEMFEYMENNNIGMCIPKIVDENGRIQAVYRRELTVYDMFIRMFCKKGFKKRKARHTMQDMDYSKPFQVPFGQGSFLVVKTDLFKELNGFDDRYFMYLEDADLCKRVNQVSKLMYYPYAKVIHRWEKGSHKNKTLFKYHLQSMFKYFAKWGIKIC